MIAHVDADSFFASVLVRKDPRLKGKPLIALGMGGSCVIAATYEAKAKGVKTGMPLKEALKLCPEALRLPSDFRETGLASEQIESILRDVCPVIEQMSVDEWYLDLTTLVGGAPADPRAWGIQVQQRILRQTDLSVSVGIGPSKLLAKMAGEYRKPAGVTTVDGRSVPGGMAIETFLRDRPAAAIPGIGPRRLTHAVSRNWETAWDIVAAPPETIAHLYGKSGTDIQHELLGICTSPVAEDTSPPKSISRCRSFRPTTDVERLWAHVVGHMQYIVLKMRRHHLACAGISAWVRDGEYRHRTRHISLPQPADTEGLLEPYVRRCFLSCLERGTSYTQAGLALWKLSPAGNTQFSLFVTPDSIVREENLQCTLDELRERFGRSVIDRGAALGTSRHPRPTVGLSMVDGR